MTLPRTQTERVLALLKARSTTGVNPTDFHAPACDGGKPILRLAARIKDLQDAGYAIRALKQPNRTATYILEDHQPSVVQHPSPQDNHSGSGLERELDELMDAFLRPGPETVPAGPHVGLFDGALYRSRVAEFD